MKTRDLAEYLGKAYPNSVAEEWDNCGLLVGSLEGETTHIVLALDMTEETLSFAKEVGGDFILTHHPMIFKGIKTVTDQTVTGRRILSLIREGINYYAMHTNYDILGMAKRSGERMHLCDEVPLTLETEEEGFGRVGDLVPPRTLGEYAKEVKEAFGLGDLRVYGDLDRMISRAAICTGSGKSFLPQVYAQGADVYVTGDIDHHTALDAMAEGLCILDAGHYGTEYIFMEDMEKELSAFLPSDVKLSKCPVHFPYTLV